MIFEKVVIIKFKCYNLVQWEGFIFICDVVFVVGFMVLVFEGVQYVFLFYRFLENDKIYVLKSNGWDFEGKMIFFFLVKQDFLWWIINVD